jgi:hypothetical protein
MEGLHVWLVVDNITCAENGTVRDVVREQDNVARIAIQHFSTSHTTQKVLALLRRNIAIVFDLLQAK